MQSRLGVGSPSTLATFSTGTDGITLRAVQTCIVGTDGEKGLCMVPTFQPGDATSATASATGWQYRTPVMGNSSPLSDQAVAALLTKFDGSTFVPFSCLWYGSNTNQNVL
jgi:hypothetical protein